jgi:hypothetical protein
VTSHITALLELRHRVPDGVLLDWVDLTQLIEPPASITTKALRAHWNCSQPAVSRRLAAVHRAGLAQITTGYNRYRVWAVKRLEVPA